MGMKLADHAIALTITIVFLLVGIWHGCGWNFVAFGAAQSLGVVVVHYYTIFLKKRLGRDGFKAYNENLWIRIPATIFTFCYFATSLTFFACTFDQLKQIFNVLQP
jgi:D-alanyl-lipoteichoic acid acyltransferase DltB (MBOAT superfamily)